MEKIYTSFSRACKKMGLSSDIPVAVAVSGGADSMTLLLLSKTYFKNLMAVTVDHGLRKESSAEAHQVHEWCSNLGINHVILSWEGEKPKTGIQRQARQARYELFRDFCQSRGISYLLTGHHLEDQMETFFLRLLRGSGVRGLAGMKGVQDLFGLKILRPLLNISKEELLTYLCVQNQSFIEDPSNHNKDFERVKIRSWIKSGASLGLSFGDIAHTQRQVAQWCSYVDRMLSNAYEECFQQDNLHLSPYFDLDEFLQKELLRYYLFEKNCKDFPPRFLAIESLHKKILKGQTTTAGGFIWRVQKDKVKIIREQRVL